MLSRHGGAGDALVLGKEYLPDDWLLAIEAGNPVILSNLVAFGHGIDKEITAEAHPADNSLASGASEV
jgi:hypothetical protein